MKQLQVKVFGAIQLSICLTSAGTRSGVGVDCRSGHLAKYVLPYMAGVIFVKNIFQK